MGTTFTGDPREVALREALNAAIARSARSETRRRVARGGGA
jgi:hypothetical protein